MRKNRTRILCGAAALVALIVIVSVGSVVIGTSRDRSRLRARPHLRWWRVIRSGVYAPNLHYS